MRRTWVVLFALSLIAGAALVPTIWHERNGSWPAPMDADPGERDPGFVSRRDAWIESLHRHAPGLDWRAQDAAWRAQRMARVQAGREAALAGGASVEDLRRVDLTAISGQWRERGSSNQAGRITGAIYDAANNRLTALSHGGNVWRADRATLAWSSPNDSASFLSSGFLDRLGGSAGERLLLASDTPTGIYRSDNGGATFSAATGADQPYPAATAGLAVRDAAAAEVYLTRVHWDFAASNWRTLLFASTDRGATFSPLGFVGESDRVALFSPRYGSSEVFVLADAALKRIVSGTQALEAVGTVPVAVAVASGDRMVLAGGVASGQVFLYALHSRRAVQRTDVYRSLDGGHTWQARTSAPTTLFGPNSAAASTRDPNLVYAGGVNLYRSSNGGASWAPVNDWSAYYGDPANRLHADIPKVEVWLDGANNERVYVSTDGGLYESTDGLATAHNLSLNGLHVSQYYSSYTQRGGAHAVLAGAQDQGYQKALAPGGHVEDFQQVISGDYGHLTSSDGGASAWMVYPGFAMFDNAPGALGQGGLRQWDFGNNGMTGALWMPPIAADRLNPASALLAGGTLGGGGNHVIRLTHAGGTISAIQEAFDFGSAVTALATSPAGTRYAVSSARQFFRDAGAGWSSTASNLPDSHYFYGNKILPDPARPGTLYVGGAGYSNPAVFVSTNDGLSFTAMSDGLPNTLVFDLAISADGNRLFAASEVGPFYFDRTQNRWIDISGLGGPNQRYWAVDFIDEGGGGVARFATYGRGLWDFRLDVIFRDGFD